MLVVVMISVVNMEEANDAQLKAVLMMLEIRVVSVGVMEEAKDA